MKNKNKIISFLLAVLMIFSAGGCKKETIDEEIQQEETPVEQPHKPQKPKPEKEQANLVDSDLMLRRVKQNLLSPLSAKIRLKEFPVLRGELSSELLEEIADLICQNYTVIRERIKVDLDEAISLQLIGGEKTQNIYINSWTNENNEEFTLVQVEEDNLMGRYIYDKTTLPALEELLSFYEEENLLEIDGECVILTSDERLEKINSEDFEVDYVMNFGENILLGFISKNNSHKNYFEIIDKKNANTIQSFEFAEEIVDVKKSDLEAYDYCIFTEKSVHYRNIADETLQFDFEIAENIQENIYSELKQPLFDFDYINNEVVYISDKGLILSNQSGKRQDLLLRNEDLYRLFDKTSEDFLYYAEPQIMDKGRIIVCPIFQKINTNTKKCLGFSLFNLMNGTSKNYINQFADIESFRYLDEETMLICGKDTVYSFDIITREVQGREWTSANNEEVYFHNFEDMFVYRQNMDYQSQIIQKSLENGEEKVILDIFGDNFEIYAVGENCFLLGWEDAQGEFAAISFAE